MKPTTAKLIKRLLSRTPPPDPSWMKQLYYDFYNYKKETDSKLEQMFLTTEHLRSQLQNIQEVINPPVEPEPVKAFPSAVGAAKDITGGRGGTIIKVTNLNDSGAGSLRAALTTTGARIVVFDVSGIIELDSPIDLGAAHSNLTVAGQTAPEGGITITNNPIVLGGGYALPPQSINNVIFRYIRHRNGRYTGVPDVFEHNGIVVTGADGLIFDHTSFSFCDDQAIAMGADYDNLINITIQNSIFSENGTGVIMGLPLTNPSGNMSFIKNLTTDQIHRNPNFGGNLRFDAINNVSFNWKTRNININSGTPDVNVIANYYRPGTATSSNIVNKVQTVVPTIYTANNYHPTLATTPGLDDQQFWTDFFNTNPVPSNRFTQTMFAVLGDYVPLTALEAYTEVINDVGANKYLNLDGTWGSYLDSFDTTKIDNVENSVSGVPENKTWVQPILPNNTRTAGYDSDITGIPNIWKAANMPVDNTANDLAPSGYTWIEEYINQVDN